MTKEDLIKMIPLYQNGPNAGRARNNELAEILRLLNSHTFTEVELEMLKKDIELCMPKRIKKEEEWEGCLTVVENRNKGKC